MQVQDLWLPAKLLLQQHRTNACTEGCFCMAENERCGNPHGLTCVNDSEESNTESSYEEEL